MNYRPRPVAPTTQSPRVQVKQSAKRSEMLRQGAQGAMALSARAKAAAGYGNGNPRKD